MNKIIQTSILISLFLILVAIRAVAIEYFYDPLIQYFKGDYNYLPVPEINYGKYFFFLFVRFCLNTLVSLGIIYVFFSNIKMVIFALKFHLGAFIFLSIVLLALLNYNLVDTYLVTFYVRRFLIHPLFLLILLPAFYYQKITRKKEDLV